MLLNKWHCSKESASKGPYTYLNRSLISLASAKAPSAVVGIIVGVFAEVPSDGAEQ